MYYRMYTITIKLLFYYEFSSTWNYFKTKGKINVLCSWIYRLHTRKYSKSHFGNPVKVLGCLLPMEISVSIWPKCRHSCDLTAQRVYQNTWGRRSIKTNEVFGGGDYGPSKHMKFLGPSKCMSFQKGKHKNGSIKAHEVFGPSNEILYQIWLCKWIFWWW